jgi:hypothetical protein
MTQQLPWDLKNEVEIGTNEFVNQFTLNRNFDRLLENDKELATALEEGVATELALDAEATTGTDETKAITPKQLHFADTEYIALSGHAIQPSLSDSTVAPSTSPTTYTIAGFEGDGLDVDNIRSIYVECTVFAGAVGLEQYTEITSTYPDNSIRSMIKTTSITSGSDNGIKTTVEIPINKTQTDVTLTITQAALAGSGSYTIIGAKQRTFAS